MNRRDLFRLALGSAALVAVPAPLRRYFIIGQPERRILAGSGLVYVVTSVTHSLAGPAVASGRSISCRVTMERQSVDFCERFEVDAADLMRFRVGDQFSLPRDRPAWETAAGIVAPGGQWEFVRRPSYSRPPRKGML